MKYLAIALGAAVALSGFILVSSWLDGDAMAQCQANGHSYENCLTNISGN